MHFCWTEAEDSLYNQKQLLHYLWLMSFGFRIFQNCVLAFCKLHENLFKYNTVSSTLYCHQLFSLLKSLENKELVRMMPDRQWQYCYLELLIKYSDKTRLLIYQQPSFNVPLSVRPFYSPNNLQVLNSLTVENTRDLAVGSSFLIFSRHLTTASTFVEWLPCKT